MNNKYLNYCLNQQQKHLYRNLIINHSLDEQLIDFSSNDYLLLSKNQQVINQSIEAIKQYGVGATGARLLSGKLPIFNQLEELIAKDKNTQRALILNSGFIANLTCLSSLLDQKVLTKRAIVFFDRLNHASLYQAVINSQSELIRYRHNDLDHLAELMKNYVNRVEPKFIVTETIFGMDGDILSIEQIKQLAIKHQAFLYLDEAHATGILGPQGYGLTTQTDLSEVDYLSMGSFSKALGSFGGYIATSKIVKNYLVNKAAGFIYSTALPPLIIKAAMTAWQLIAKMDNERLLLKKNAKKLRKKLKSLGFDIGLSTTHIIPIIFKDERLTDLAKEKLLEKQIIVSSIKPPTVPTNKSRLRIALNIGHSDEQLNYLVDELQKL